MILMTPADVVKAGHKLWAYCARCRRNVLVDAEKLCAAGKAAAEISKLRFNCAKCGEPGQPSVTGHVGGERKTWE
jgi:hypothetical protein